jgi:hypothetical protein
VGLAEVLREIHGIRQFRLAFCLETTERFMSDGYLRALVRRTQADVMEGFYDFLPSPPVVFSRAPA